MAEHSFIMKAHWPGLRNDCGELDSEGLRTKISIPPEMDGPGVGTNPDEMLLGAAATCYIITLAAMLERTGIKKVDLSMESEGIVDVTNGVFTYIKIIHRPVLTLPANTADADIHKAQRLAEKAETSCMISRALQGNVDIELQYKVSVVGS